LSLNWGFSNFPLVEDEASFAIVLELKENTVPSASKDNEPPPWVPADRQHTTSGASEEAQLHLLRAVDTGIINISLAVQESEHKLQSTKNLHDST
jgi:mitotic spindle assembly checkpoint protein MAD2B